MTPAVWIAGGVTAAAVVSAVSFSLAARSVYHDCDTTPACSDARLDSLKTRALAADVLWGAALAGAVTTGVLYWLSGGDGGEAPQLTRHDLKLGPTAGFVGVSLWGTL